MKRKHHFQMEGYILCENELSAGLQRNMVVLLQHCSKERTCVRPDNTAAWWAREHVLAIRGSEVVSVHELGSYSDPAHRLTNSATCWPFLLPQYPQVHSRGFQTTASWNKSIYYSHRAFNFWTCHLTKHITFKYTLFISLFVKVNKVIEDYVDPPGFKP